MLVAADLHIHSRFSRATSKSLDLFQLAEWAGKKGVSILATGDFTHPEWRKEMRENLIEDGSGFLKLKAQNSKRKVNNVEQTSLFGGTEQVSKRSSDSCDDFIADEVRFVLSTELSTIYKDGEKTRKVHHVFLAPDLETADKVSNELVRRKFNIFSDGRPILGLTSRDLCELVFSVNADCQLIPAHVWTPWFSVFGSKSGYDNLEDCYGEFTERILALETGLSSDPEMNWRWSYLDRFTLVSNSDAHSASKIARECNVFHISDPAKLGYSDLVRMIKKDDPREFVYTVEFYPQEGKYHWDGHRMCQVQWSPTQTKEHNGLCSKCGQMVTVGVDNRVQELADREDSFVPEGKPASMHLVPLEEVISSACGVGKGSKKVQGIYDALVEEYGSELAILISRDIDSIKAFGGERVGSAIENMRAGKIDISPGYDGEFGKVQVVI